VTGEDYLRFVGNVSGSGLEQPFIGSAAGGILFPVGDTLGDAVVSCAFTHK